MPRPDAPPLTRGVVLRAVGLALAVALGAVAVWLIVTSHSQKKLELGVLAGLWGLLLGAFTMFGSRRATDEAALTAALAAAGANPGSGLELRSRATELERAEDVAARRAHEARIEEILRQEIRGAVTREVSSLRAEIAQLRTDLLEKVGGQLRLERIETTRVIGSDLEALQDEVRALKGLSRDVDGGALLRDFGRARVRTVESLPEYGSPAAPPTSPPMSPPPQGARVVQRPAAARVLDAAQGEQVKLPPRNEPPIPAAAQPAAAEQTGPISPARVAAARGPEPSIPAREPASPVSQMPPRTGAAAARVASAARVAPPSVATPPAPGEPEPAPTTSTPAPARSNGSPQSEVFAGLPRLTPFVDDTPAPASPPARAAQAKRPQTPPVQTKPAAEQPPVPSATREHQGTEHQASERQGSEHHASERQGSEHHASTTRQPGPGQPGYEGRRRRTDGSAPAGVANGAKTEEPGGRRRRVDDANDDLLARLLARESH